MSQVTREAIVPYTCRQMYDLVTDVSAYPKFLSWCNSVDVEHLDEKRVKVRLGVRYHKAVDLSFTTVNTNQPYETVSMELADGPFKHMNGKWSFTPLGNSGSKVIFQLDYEFNKSLQKILMNRIFSELSDSLLDAFQARAKEVYDAVHS